MAKESRVDRACHTHATARRRRDLENNDAAWPEWQAAATDYWVESHPEAEKLRRGDPATTPSIDEIRARGEALAHAMDGIPSHWRLEPHSPERDERAAQVGFAHELNHGLYDPIYHAIDRARRGDSGGVETLVRFLEADVYSFRSGYAKADAIRAITRLDIDDRARARLIVVVLQVVEGPDRREFRAYIRLARFLNGPQLREALELQHASSDRRTARHARWMLNGLAAGGPLPRMLKPPV